MSVTMPVTHRIERNLELVQDRTPPADKAGNLRMLRTNRERSKHDNVLSGQLKEMSLFSILQALSENANTGNLRIEGGTQPGDLYFERGQLVYAGLGRHRGPKALYRLVGITEGRFEFFSPGRDPAERNLAGSLDMHLIEAARHQDEMVVLREEIPAGGTVLRFNKNMVASVAKTPYPMLEVMAAIHKHENIAAILDGCSLPDLDVVKILITLFQNNVVRFETN